MNRRNPPECSFDGCSNKAVIKGMCVGHNTQRIRKRGMRPLKAHRKCPDRHQTCKAEGCGRRTWAMSLCNSHYKMTARGKELGPLGPAFSKGERLQETCVVPGCERPHRSWGYCTNHRDILRSYSIDPSEYQRRLDAQRNQCAICQCACSVNSRLSIDHDHNTGRIRGFLCNSCNAGLGQFKDNPDLLRKAAEYLEDSHTIKSTDTNKLSQLAVTVG